MQNAEVKKRQVKKRQAKSDKRKAKSEKRKERGIAGESEVEVQSRQSNHYFLFGGGWL